MSETFKCNVAVFRSEADVQHVVMPDGHRFVIIMRGSDPHLAPIDEPGVYEIDALDIGGAIFPVGLCVVDLAHVNAWLNLPEDAVERMIDRIEHQIQAHAEAS